MRLWTMLQEPLSQVALVENGKITKRIPNHPPQTLSRQVKAISEFDGNLIIGRRNSIEMWTPDGNQMIKSVYHPWIYGLHEIIQFGDELLIACAHLDVVFRLNWDGECTWSWWAYKEGYSAEPTFINDENWQTVQLTEILPNDDSVHLNSIKIHEDMILVTLMRKKLVVMVNPHDQYDKSSHVRQLPEEAHCPHDFLYHKGMPVYGRDIGIVINEKIKSGYQFVKRIKPLDDTLLFTHEKGITQTNFDGRVITDWTLPKPYGFALVDMEG